MDFIKALGADDIALIASCIIVVAAAVGAIVWATIQEK